MTDLVEKKSLQAWQPMTPRGVAAFARAPVQHLWALQCFFALVAAVVVVWFLKTAWFPAILDAIRALPEHSEIASGKLRWRQASPQLLAEGHFLAFVVDTNHSATIRSPAHIQIEFGTDDFRTITLGGYYSKFYYVNESPIQFSRTEIEPWWGAWRPPILWIAFGATFVSCFCIWTALSGVYVFPAWLAAFLANRALNFIGAWKISGAALMPGAALMIAGIVFYGLGALDLVQLAAVAAGHVIAGWMYLAWAIHASPKISAVVSTSDNPFVAKIGEPQEKSEE